MPRPKQDPVDRIVNVWRAATPEQRNLALRIIGWLDALGTGAAPTQDPPKPKEKRVRAAKKAEQAPEAQP